MSNETGDVWLVFNGEIWNYKELRKELIEKGHLFRTNSDTETIVHAYEEYGVGCVARLHGARPRREKTSLLYPSER
jgi:asparagine synthase (glutamine-hydrolysing)